MTINAHSFNASQDLGGEQEQWELWLRDESAPMGFLIEFDYNGTSAVYGSWIRYTLKTSNFPKVGYIDRIKSVGSFKRQLGERFKGQVVASLGEVVFDNADGALDLWHNLALDGQRVVVKVGHPDWDAARFRIAYECVAECVSSSDLKELKVRLRAPEYKYNLPIQTSLLVPVNPTTASDNTPIPLAKGIVFNVTPVEYDSSNQIWQWNDGAVTSVDRVRDGGIPFETPMATISSVVGNLITTTYAHGFVKDTRIRVDLGTLPSISGEWRVCWNGRIFCAVCRSTGTSSVYATSLDGIVWTTRALPIAADWSAIAWNGTVFCIVPNNATTALTSPDGINWTSRTLPFSIDWKTIVWNGSVFLATGGGGSGGATGGAATSPDGITWTGRTMPSNRSWWSLTWSGSVFCCVGYGSSVCATSPDGITWTTGAMPSSRPWRAVAYGGGVFVASSLGFSNGAVSTDGLTWTATSLPGGDDHTTLIYGGGLFCSLALTSLGTVDTSPDGVTWTRQTLPTTTYWTGGAWDGVNFVVLGQSAYASRSGNGVTWTTITNVLPTPLAVNTDYWVIADGLTSLSYKLSATRSGAVITLTNTTAGCGVIGYHWTADLTTGKLYLDSKPAGKLTLDGVAGSTDAATAIIAALSAINVDPVSKLKFQAKCAQAIGVYTSDRQNRITVADSIASGLGAWYGHGRAGMFKLGRVEGTPTEYDFELRQDDIKLDTIKIESLVPPEKQHRVGFRKNWTNQNGALFAGVSIDDRVLYSNDYSITPAQSSTDVGVNGGFHALAIIPDYKESLMAYSADALAEAIREDAMYFGWGMIISLEVGKIGLGIDLGDVVKVPHTRFGLSAGVSMTCIDIDDQWAAKRVVLRFFVALTAYTPGQLP